MKERKTYLRALRVTQGADLLIDRICEVCNDPKHNAKINGDEDVNGSAVLGYLFEKIVHTPKNKEEVLSDILYNVFKLKNAEGEQKSLEEVTRISREIVHGNQS